MQHDDIIEIITPQRIRRTISIRRIYEYEENIEDLITTNSKPERREDNYTISIE